LSDFDHDFVGEALDKQDIKDHWLDGTKGCHLYSLSRPGGAHLRMAVAMGKRLLLLQWRHTAAWTAWCPSSDTDTVEGFQVLREFHLNEAALIITLIDGNIVSPISALNSTQETITDNHICVGYKHQFDVVNERTGEIRTLHTIDSSWVNLVSAIDVYEDDEPELLLCYNRE
jgi:hypothetical protein